MGKRVFDICFSLIALILLLPCFLLICIGILLSSPGKIFYIQKRLGRGGKIFKCYKFRTMHQDAERQLSQILNNNPSYMREWKSKQKLTFDPRVFSFGRFLRKTSLDELPQFWNVLKGDLSLVGPRPYMVCQQHALGNSALVILSIHPGMTGLWQTSGRSSKTFQERIYLDTEYVVKRSFWLDLFLIIKTIPVIFLTKDAC